MEAQARRFGLMTRRRSALIILLSYGGFGVGVMWISSQSIRLDVAIGLDTNGVIAKENMDSLS